MEYDSWQLWRTRQELTDKRNTDISVQMYREIQLHLDQNEISQQIDWDQLQVARLSTQTHRHSETMFDILNLSEGFNRY